MPADDAAPEQVGRAQQQRELAGLANGAGDVAQQYAFARAGIG